MKQSLEKRIILFSFSILFLTILANTAMEIAVFRKEYRNELILRTQTLGTSFKGTIEKVLALGIEIHDVNGLDEKCRELIQTSPETSYCTISDMSGETLVASDKDFAARNLVNGRKKGSYPSNARIVATPHGDYIDVQTSLMSFDSRQVATLHIGFPLDAINQKIYPILARSMLILLLFFSISFAMVVFFVKRSIISPIAQLLEGITHISNGDFTTHVNPLPLHELDQLGNQINSMSAILKNREQELNNNYDELASAHTQLHNSFLRLETLSRDLEKSEELYKTLQEEAGDTIIILDESQHIIIANKMAESFLDVPAAQLVGLHISNLLIKLAATDITLPLTLIAKAFEGAPVDDEMLFHTSSGEQRSGRIHASCVMLDEKKLLQIIIRDITREREILKNLESSAAGLARLNRMKDSFLGLASHELKTPLTVIMGYSELLLTDMRTNLNDLSIEMVQHISNAALRLDGIIKDMIDVSMIDQKQLGLKLEPIMIHTLLEFSLKELQFFFSQRKQTVVTNFSPDIPSIKGDQTRLLQLFSNILGNAIKFTPDGGTISITTALRPLMTDNSPSGIGSDLPANVSKTSQKFIEITITDTGIGIDKEDQQRIFDKFYEAGNIEEHSSGKIAFKARGAGLGLSIAKGIVEMHGGLIRVESIGHNPETLPGSSFIILLPLDVATTDGML